MDNNNTLNLLIMKKTYLLIFSLMVGALGFSQNQSDAKFTNNNPKTTVTITPNLSTNDVQKTTIQLPKNNSNLVIDSKRNDLPSTILNTPTSVKTDTKTSDVPQNKTINSQKELTSPTTSTSDLPQKKLGERTNGASTKSDKSTNDKGISKSSLQRTQEPFLSPNAETCSFTGTLASSDLIMTSRLLRPGAPTGACGVNYSAPSIAGAGSSYYYDSINITNSTGLTQCVNFSLASSDPVANMQFAVYNNVFNPNDLTQNYLGDPGSSSGTPAVTTTCNITIQNGASLVIVIFNVNASQAMTTNYTLSVSGLPCPPSCSYTGILSTTDQIMTSRLLRPGAPTGYCGLAYASPSIAGAGSSYYYDTLYLSNSTGYSQCVTFSLANPDAAANTQFAVYNNSFNPDDLTQNYLGDPGLSSGTPGVTTTCTITVPNGANLVVVIFNVNASQAMTSNYTLTVTGLICPPTCSYSGILATTDQTMTSRLLRPGAPTGNCGLTYSNPSIAGAGSSYYYDTLTISNTTGYSQCVTFSLANPDPVANLQFAVYNNSFNPSDLTQNYLGDPGLSSGTPAVTTSCMITIPNGANLVVVIFNVNASQAMTANYTLTVTGLPCPPTCSYTGTVTTADSVMTSRLLRPGAPTGNCGLTYSTPSIAGAGSNYYYKTLDVSNSTGYSQCVTFSLASSDPVANMQFAVYNNSFNPNDLTQNYLGDPGSSSGTPAATTSCSITIPNGANLVIVIFNVNASQAMTTNYTFTVTGLPCPPSCSYTGILASSDQIMTSRLLRPGAPTGNCGLTYSNPSIAGAGSSYYYDTFYLSNTTGTTKCVNFSLANPDPAANLQFAVYNNSFNPNDLTQNYLGDPGLSSGTPAVTTSCNITIPSGASFVVVIFNVNASQAMTANYTLTVTGLPCPPSCSYPGTLASTDQIMTSRLLRPGAPTGNCGLTYSNPSIAGAGSNYYYDTHNFSNTTGYSQCVTFSLEHPDPVANLQFAVYNTSFNPNDLTQNYLGDPGLSSGTPAVTTSCMINIPDGANLVVVVFNVNASQAMTTNYTLTASGLTCDVPSLSGDEFETDARDGVIVYPNPTENMLYIKGIDAKFVHVYSIEGKQINVNFTDNTVDTQNLSSGIYLIQIGDGNKTVITKKFIKK